MIELHADLYHSLAEALTEPPEWLARRGSEWPLFEVVTRFARHLAVARHAVAALAEVGAESLAARRARYAALFAGPGRPRFWLYESAHRSGRLLGPETFSVERLYRAAGLNVLGAELPDHASLELAFLGYLAEQGAADLEKVFIEKHAGLWLPQLGRELARTGDEVYAPLGQLLADWLTEAVHTHRLSPPVAGAARPTILQADACTLCGFCGQVCPTRALALRENEDETALVLLAAGCTGCGKCERTCPTQALTMQPLSGSTGPSGIENTLRQSPRAVCPACGERLVSQAELSFVAAQLGHPAWLKYCLSCRQYLVAAPVCEVESLP